MFSSNRPNISPLRHSVKMIILKQRKVSLNGIHSEWWAEWTSRSFKVSMIHKIYKLYPTMNWISEGFSKPLWKLRKVLKNLKTSLYQRSTSINSNHDFDLKMINICESIFITDNFLGCKKTVNTSPKFYIHENHTQRSLCDVSEAKKHLNEKKSSQFLILRYTRIKFS